jgi:hypothetical protein
MCQPDVKKTFFATKFDTKDRLNAIFLAAIDKLDRTRGIINIGKGETSELEFASLLH